MAISKWKKTIGTVLQRVCIYETLNYNEDILIPYGWESMAPSPSKERKSVYDIGRLVYTTWQRNRIENSKLNEIDGISSAKRAFHRLCSSNRGVVLLSFSLRRFHSPNRHYSWRTSWIVFILYTIVKLPPRGLSIHWTLHIPPIGGMHRSSRPSFPPWIETTPSSLL